MGLFWDLMQQSQISEQREHAASLEQRVNRLERDLERQQQLLSKLVQTLETHFGEDIDRDGRIG